VKDIIKKLHKYEIRIRKMIHNRMHGNFHSIFKGSGLEFDDVRSYQYGDDVRAIDWNVSAKGHGTYLKTFKEEKEQTVMFILDVSASQEIGKTRNKKIDIAREICGVLSLSAAKESGNVGVVCFSNQKEIYIRPDKGLFHAYNIILNIFKLKPKSLMTDLNKCLKYALGLLKKKSMVIFISDFIDTGYEKNLTAMARKHDLVVIHLSDSREVQFPKLGIIPIFDMERKKTFWVNSSSPKFREKINNNFVLNRGMLQGLCRKHSANYLWIDTQEEYVEKLVQLFRLRNTSGS
jgi:uncharacterized protein (DUF58 family)